MTDLTLVIGNKNYSSWSLRPWLAMKKAGIGFSEKQIMLDKPETQSAIRAINPAGTVPVLLDGSLTIADSLAIIEYCAEISPALWPSSRAQRAKARSISCEMHSGFSALRNQMPMNVRATNRFIAADDAVLSDVERIQTIFFECLKGKSEKGPWLFGNFCAADAMFAPVVSRFLTYQVTLKPEIQVYVETLWNDPLMIEWRKAAAIEKESIGHEEVGIQT